MNFLFHRGHLKIGCSLDIVEANNQDCRIFEKPFRIFLTAASRRKKRTSRKEQVIKYNVHSFKMCPASRCFDVARRGPKFFYKQRRGEKLANELSLRHGTRGSLRIPEFKKLAFPIAGTRETPVEVTLAERGEVQTQMLGGKVR